MAESEDDLDEFFDCMDEDEFHTAGEDTPLVTKENSESKEQNAMRDRISL